MKNLFECSVKSVEESEARTVLNGAPDYLSVDEMNLNWISIGFHQRRSLTGVFR